MGCKNAGATRIIGVDVNPGKFEMGNFTIYNGSELAPILSFLLF